MKQAIPWSVKGVDANARDAAKDAARRAGMTLGEWLNTVIVETAAEREQREAREERERSPDQRHEEPVTNAEEERAAAKLASLEARLEQLSRRAGDTALPRGAGARDERRHGAPAERNDLASVIERAMRENQARTEAVEAKTASALDSMVRFMERADSRRQDEMSSLAQAQERTSNALREALTLVTTRMDSLERSVSQKGASELEPIKAAILRLEERLVRRDPAPLGKGASRIQASINDLETRLVDIADKLAETEQNGKRDAEKARSARISRIEEKLAAVLDALDGRATAPLDPDLDDEQEDAAPAASLDEAISQIRARQEHLQGVRARRSEEAERTVSMLEGLRGDVVNLAHRLDAMDQPRDPPSIEAMRRDLADLARSVQTIHNRSDFAALERSILEVSDRIDDWRRSDGSDSIVGPARRTMEDMRALVEELRPVANLSGLREDIGQLAAKLDRAPAGGLPAEVVEAILSQIADLRTAVGKAARPVSLEPLERQVASLAARLDLVLAKRPRGGAGGAGADVAGLASLSEAAADIRDALRAFRPEENFSRIERRLEELGQSIAAREGDRGAYDDLRSRLDRVQSTLEQKAAGPDLSPLEGLIRSLGDKLAAVESGAQDRPSLDGLAAQLTKMTAALERSGEGFSTLRTMERSIGDLFAKIDEAKLGAFEAADVAARKAVEQAAALVSGDQPRGGTEFAEVRTRQTLEAVHDTLEKIVERLGMLESDIASDRVRLMDVAEKAASRAPSPAESQPQPTQAGAAVAHKMAAAAAAAEAARAMAAPAPTPPAAAKPANPRAASADRPAAQPPLPLMDLADDLPLEPGSGRPNTVAVDGEMSRIDAPESAQASFIAAARKAAQTAQAQAAGPTAKSLFSLGRGEGKATEAKPAKPSKPVKGPEGTEGADDGASRVSQVRAYVEAKRRPILIGLAAVVLALGSAQIARNFLEAEGAGQGAPQPRVDAPRREPTKQSQAPAPATDKQASAPASDKQAAAQLLAPQPAAPQSFTPAGPVSPPTASFSASESAKDPATVGSLGQAPSPAPGAAGPQSGPGAIALPPGSWPKGLARAAEQNDPAALYEIAARLGDGRGATRDPKLAAQWFEKAANLGFAPAQYRLGSAYEKGVGVGKDLAQAKTWYQRAAEAGNAKAMHNLGVLVAEGVGGKPDYAAAAAWFRKAAELGVRDSQYNLAILAARGLGVQQNLGESWLWFSLANAQGDQDAGKKRDEVAARMDAEALKAAQAALQAFKAKPQDPKANDVAAPAGGWDQEPVGQQGLPKGKSARL